MKETWIRANLPMNNGMVVLETYEDLSFQGIEPASLADMTSTISDPPTYSALSALPIAKAGWQRFFDDWKAKGIIS